MAIVQMKNRSTKPFVKNSKIIHTLPLGGKIRAGRVVVAGNVVLSAGTASGTVLGEGGPINLVKRIIVTATPGAGSRYPGGKIVDCTPRSLLRYAQFQHNGKFFGELAASTLGSGAAGTYPIYLSIPIYWSDATLRNSYATSLNTDPGTYASVQVEVQTGDIKSCFNGNDRTEDYSGLTVQWVDDRIALDGDTNVRYQEDHVMLIAATQERAMDDAMPRDGNFECWQILAESGGPTSLALNNTVFQKITIDGPTIGAELWAQDIQQRMLDDEWVDPSQTLAGTYFLDFTDGTLANTVPAAGLETRIKVNNISGSNNDDLLIYTRRVFSPAPAGK